MINKKLVWPGIVAAVVAVIGVIIVNVVSPGNSLSSRVSNIVQFRAAENDITSTPTPIPDPVLDPEEPEETGTAVAASDIRYGLWAEQREEEMFKLTSAAYIKLGNGVNSNPGIEASVATIKSAEANKVSLIVSFVPATLYSNPCGGTPGSSGCSGKYFHDKYLDALDDWTKPGAVKIRSAVQDAVDNGTIQYAYVADEPSRKDRYSYTEFSNARIDEISKRYKQIFPGIKTTIRQQSKQFAKTANGSIAYGRDDHQFKYLDSVIAFSHPDRVAAVRKVSGKTIGGWTDSEQLKITKEWMEADMKIQRSNGIPETLFGIQTVTTRTHANTDLTTSRTKSGGSAHKIMTSPRWIRNQLQAMASLHKEIPGSVSPLIIQFRYDRAPGEHSYALDIPKAWKDDLKLADDYPTFNPGTMLEAITQIHNDIQ